MVAGKIARLLVFAGVIDELKSRAAISSFMKGDPVRAELQAIAKMWAGRVRSLINWLV